MNKIKTVLVILLIMATVQLSKAQEVEKVLLINVYENFKENENSRIIVSENDKVLEQLPLPGFTGRNYETTQLEVNRLLYKYRRAGYVLKETLRGSNLIWGGSTVMVSTYIFEK